MFMFAIRRFSSLYTIPISMVFKECGFNEQESLFSVFYNLQFITTSRQQTSRPAVSSFFFCYVSLFFRSTLDSSLATRTWLCSILFSSLLIASSSVRGHHHPFYSPLPLSYIFLFWYISSFSLSKLIFLSLTFFFRFDFQHFALNSTFIAEIAKK